VTIGRSFQDPLAVPCPSCGDRELYRLSPEDLDAVTFAHEPYPILCKVCTRKTSVPFLVCFFVRAGRYSEALSALCTKVTPRYFAIPAGQPIRPFNSEDIWLRLLTDCDYGSRDLASVIKKSKLSLSEFLIIKNTEYVEQRPDWWLFQAYDERSTEPEKLVYRLRDIAVFGGIQFKAWLLQAWLLNKLKRGKEAMLILRLLTDKLFGERPLEDVLAPSPAHSTVAPLSVLFRLLGLTELDMGREASGFAWLQLAGEARFTTYEAVCQNGECLSEIELSRDLLAQSGAVGEIYLESEKVRLEMLARSGFKIN